MSRTKGSKNKKTLQAQHMEDSRSSKKEKIEEEVLNEQLDEIEKEIAVNLPCKNCRHSVDMHYGSDEKHCNTNNCPCLKYEL